MAHLRKHRPRADGLIFTVVLIFLGVLFVNYVVLSTPKDHAYRNLDPSVPVCAEGLEKGWTILAETGREKLQGVELNDDDGWIDPSNDETEVVASDPKWAPLCDVRCNATSCRHPRPRENRSIIISAFSNSKRMANPMRSSRLTPKAISQ